MINQALGQHWLKDRSMLEAVASHAEIKSDETVLEIGPGLGTLTSVLLGQAAKVVAVEFDSKLAQNLPAQFPGKNLEVVNGDILQFNLKQLPVGYKAVANVPYYITSKIIEKLLTSDNQPSLIVLLVQKEVAERLAARPGNMSLLSVSAQLFAEVSLGEVVAAGLFTPPPKVDSQVVVFKTFAKPLVLGNQQKIFFRVVKAGFREKRKKLRSSLSAGLAIDKASVEKMLKIANVNPDGRSQELSIDEWLKVAEAYGGR